MRALAVGLVAMVLASGGLAGFDDRSAAADDPPEDCVITGGGHAGPGEVGGGCERGGSGGSGGRGGPPENGTWERTITTGPCEEPEEGEVEPVPGAGKGGKCASWTCKAEPGAEYRRIWSRTETYRDGGRVAATPWHLEDTRCIAPPVPSADAVSDWVVHQLPKGEPVVQPENGRTLVGFPTNFLAHTDENPFVRGTELAGYRVDVRAVPVSYTWHWGDGTEPFTTDQPGRRWSPGAVLPVVHEYRNVGPVEAYVDVGYRATYRVDGGRERPIPEIVTATGGPRKRLEVLEVKAFLGN